jgi:hypothetical protein
MNTPAYSSLNAANGITDQSDHDRHLVLNHRHTFFSIRTKSYPHTVVSACCLGFQNSITNYTNELLPQHKPNS